MRQKPDRKKFDTEWKTFALVLSEFLFLSRKVSTYQRRGGREGKEEEGRRRRRRKGE